MIRIAVWAHDLSESHLRRITQLGADAVDGVAVPFAPGGHFDPDALRQLDRKVRAWGLQLNRLSLPPLGEAFIDEEDGGQAQLEACCQSIRAMGEIGACLARVHFARDTYPWMNRRYQALHRGGYTMRGESLVDKPAPPPSPARQEHWWSRVCVAYEKMVPIAQDCGVKLMMHPSDTPNADTPFGGLNFHRLIDAFPSPQVGYLYCCGTRAEAGGGPLVLDEINNYGRKGRLFEIHFRNLRGSLPTAGGFEEVLLDDGDMNMFKLLRALHQVGFDGCLNPDHYPTLEGDSPLNEQALAYSVGYIKALLAALAAN